MRITLVVLLLAILCSYSSAQTEMGDANAPAKSWTMLSIHRVWSPQFNWFPNGGFGINQFFSVSEGRQAWFGFSVIGTGIDRRDAVAITLGPGFWLLGDSRFGLYTYAMMGLGVSSANGLTGFGFFSDPTTVFGLASQGGLGVSYELFSNLKIHLNGFGMWFTADNGATPLGVQFGLTLGGR